MGVDGFQEEGKVMVAKKNLIFILTQQTMCRHKKKNTISTHKHNTHEDLVLSKVQWVGGGGASMGGFLTPDYVRRWVYQDCQGQEGISSRFPPPHTADSHFL